MRYAVLHHTGVAEPHFDLLYELASGDERLTTFRCPRWPLEIGDEIEELPEHRSVYLDYEGPVSNDRGHVTRIDAGSVRCNDLSVDPPTIGLRLESESDSMTQIVVTEIGATTRWIVSMVSADKSR